MQFMEFTCSVTAVQYLCLCSVFVEQSVYKWRGVCKMFHGEGE